jgi:hypothetical protein
MVKSFKEEHPLGESLEQALTVRCVPGGHRQEAQRAGGGREEGQK